MTFSWNVLLASFGITLVAELACLGRTVALIERYGYPLSVALGTLGGYFVITIASYYSGIWIKDNIPAYIVRLLPGMLLICVGVLLLFEK